MEDENVDQYACDRYIKPYRKRPARDQWVFVIVTADRTRSGHQDYRYEQGGEDDMRSQQREIKWSDNPLAFKWHITDICMIGQVWDQEYHRDGHRRDHTIAMCVWIIFFNKIVTQAYYCCDRGIKWYVEMRQIGYYFVVGHSGLFLSLKMMQDYTD